jgi:hypothetical protein
VKIDRELFEEWLANPVTEYVLAKVKETAEANKAAWISMSWDGGKADQLALVELKARYEAGLDLSELKYEDVSDDESERRVPDRVQGTYPAD